MGEVIQTPKAILAKHGLAVSQFPTSMTLGNGEMAIGVSTLLLHTSGEWWEDTIYVPESGTAKNPAQEAGITISYLRRYGYSAVLGMYSEEDTDGEGVSERQKKPSKPPVQKPAPQKTEQEQFDTDFPPVGEKEPEQKQEPDKKQEDPKQPKWPDEFIASLIVDTETHKAWFENKFEALNALKLSHRLKPGITPLGNLQYWVKKYKEGRSENKPPTDAAGWADDEYDAAAARHAQDKATERTANGEK